MSGDPEQDRPNTHDDKASVTEAVSGGEVRQGPGTETDEAKRDPTAKPPWKRVEEKEGGYVARSLKPLLWSLALIALVAAIVYAVAGPAESLERRRWCGTTWWAEAGHTERYRGAKWDGATYYHLVEHFQLTHPARYFSWRPCYTRAI